MVFDNCSSLSSITFSGNVTSIGNHAFYECNSLISITLPDSITSIFYCSFLRHKKIEITISSVNPHYKTVDGVLFNKNGSKLMQYPQGKKDTSYSVPENVTSIDDCAFYKCSSLISITLPDSITSIGDNSFKKCIQLEEITVSSANSHYRSVDDVLCNEDGRELIYPPGKKKTKNDEL